MKLILSLLIAGLSLSVPIHVQSASNETPPRISLDTNCGSYFYPSGNVIMEAPALGFNIDPSLSLIPLYTYAKKWGDLILYNEKNNKLQQASPLAFASEETRKNIPDEYFSEKYHYINYAVQGKDYYLPANKGEIFKEYPGSRDLCVTPRQRNEKLCVVNDYKEAGTVEFFRISVVDTKTKKDSFSFEWSCSTSDPGFMFSELEWVDNRYLLQVSPCRRWTFLKIIDLQKKTVVEGNFGDAKEIQSAAVINGKVIIMPGEDEKGIIHPYEFPLEH